MRLLRGTKKDSDRDSISDVSDCSDETDCDSVSSEDTVRESNNIGKFLLPEHDELLDSASDKMPDASSDTASLTDDDSSTDTSSDAGSIEEERQAYLANMEDSINRLRDREVFYVRSVWIDDDPLEDDDSLYDDPRYIAYGWHHSCLQLLEDIDFEFVYALHTFVATVEGQANCTKGDTMVLLDDSNSYWWLVRVVKDGSIGENILFRSIFLLYLMNK